MKTAPPDEPRVVVVTGASSGIGLALAERLARGGHRVEMVCRTESRGEAALARVRELGGVDRVRLYVADLSLTTEVTRVAQQLRAANDHIDVLVNNAGVQLTDRTETPQGVEQTFAVNVLAPFMLTRQLEPSLRRAEAARVVNVSSLVHKWGELHWDDLELKSGYDSDAAYYQSKLASLMLTFEQARRWEGGTITVNAAHPGMVKTHFARDFRGFRKHMARLWRIFMITPEESARHLARVCLDPEYDGVTGRYFVEGKPATSAPRSLHREQWGRLWELCEARVRQVGAGDG